MKVGDDDDDDDDDDYDDDDDDDDDSHVNSPVLDVSAVNALRCPQTSRYQQTLCSSCVFICLQQQQQQQQQQQLALRRRAPCAARHTSHVTRHTFAQ